MNSFVAVLTVMSMLAAVAMSSDCSTECDAECANVNAQCKMESAGILGSLCATNNDDCQKACAVSCGCVDGCTAKCQGPFDNCQANANGNIVLAVGCTAERDVCLGVCGVDCANQVVVGTVQSALGGGGQ